MTKPAKCQVLSGGMLFGDDLIFDEVANANLPAIHCGANPLTSGVSDNNDANF